MTENATEQTPDEAADTALPAPRTRWAAILWGLVFAGIALWSLRVFGDVTGRADLASWLAALTPASAIGYLVLGVGALVLLLGLIGVLRRAQRRRERS